MNYLDIAKKFHYKHRLGQNFLINPDILSFIVSSANVNPDETVLEIGPGPGFLTKLLAEKAKEVIAVEIDSIFIDYLNTLNIDNLRLIHSDFLKVRLSDLTDHKIKVVANIPYYITTPILVHLFGELDQTDYPERKLVSEIIMMVQKEVGQRIVACNTSKNKEWGALSVLVNFWTEPEIIHSVPPSSFWPRPKVDSVIMRLKIRENPAVSVQNPHYLKRVVKASFTFRRKTLKNALSMSGFSSNIVIEAIAGLGLNENIRGECLSLEQYAQLADTLKNLERESSQEHADNKA